MKEKLNKEFPKCKFCWDKGYATQLEFATGRNFTQQMPYYLPCKYCDRGKQIKKLMHDIRLETLREIEQRLSDHIDESYPKGAADRGYATVHIVMFLHYLKKCFMRK